MVDNIDIDRQIDCVRDNIANALYLLGRVMISEEVRYYNLTRELQDGEVGSELSRHIDAVELAIARLHEVLMKL